MEILFRVLLALLIQKHLFSSLTVRTRTICILLWMIIKETVTMNEKVCDLYFLPLENFHRWNISDEICSRIFINYFIEKHRIDKLLLPLVFRVIYYYVMSNRILSILRIVTSFIFNELHVIDGVLLGRFGGCNDSVGFDSIVFFIHLGWQI